MILKRITAPALEPVTLATAKAHMRVAHASEDALIPLYISAAVAYLDGKDGILGRALYTQTWELSLDVFPCGRTIEIPLPPLQSVMTLKYFDVNNVEQTLSSARYTVDISSEPARIIIDSTGWPDIYDRPNAINIRFVCGYGTESAIPASLRAAMLLHIGDLYENRQTGQAQEFYQNPAFMSLICPYRIISV